MANTNICELAYTGDVSQLKKLVEADETLIHKTDDSKRVALHWAALGGSVELTDFLLRRGTFIDVTDDVMITLGDDLPFQFSNASPHLLELSFTTQNSGWTPLMLASSAGKIDVVKFLLSKKAAVNVMNGTKQSPLHYACSKDHTEIVDLLLNNDANPNTRDNYGATPLHRAASKGNVKVTERLLCDKHINVNLADSEGNTPLHLACMENRVETASLLVKHGAKLNLLNKDEKRPSDVAEAGLCKTLQRLSEK